MNRLSVGVSDSVDSPTGSLLKWRARVVHVQRLEMAVVHSQVQIGRRTLLRPLALALNHLGNGWMYPLLAAMLLWYYPHEFADVALVAGVAAGASHLIYPWIKRAVARLRPFEVDQKMVPLLRPLDRYSFPSGHCMTITAVLIPVCGAHSTLAVPATLACLAIAWARLVAAHHYPSDLLAGTALGAVVALPVVWTLL